MTKLEPSFRNVVVLAKTVRAARMPANDGWIDALCDFVRVQDWPKSVQSTGPAFGQGAFPSTVRASDDQQFWTRLVHATRGNSRTILYAPRASRVYSISKR